MACGTTCMPRSPRNEALSSKELDAICTRLCDMMLPKLCDAMLPQFEKSVEKLLDRRKSERLQSRSQTGKTIDTSLFAENDEEMDQVAPGSSEGNKAPRRSMSAVSKSLEGLYGEWTRKHFRSYSMAAMDEEERRYAEEEEFLLAEHPAEHVAVAGELHLTQEEEELGEPLMSSPSRRNLEASAPTLSSRCAAVRGRVRDCLKERTKKWKEFSSAWRVWRWMEWVMSRERFEYVMSFLVLLNSVTMGIETDFQTKGLPLPRSLVIISNVFCAVFTIELVLRFLINPWRFMDAEGAHWGLFCWNLFDVVVVACQLFDTLSEDSDDGTMRGFEVMRSFRILRILRLLRVIRYFTDLRLLLTSMYASLYSLFWSLIMLICIIYGFALMFCQITSQPGASATHAELFQKYFGSMHQSMMTLLECITGGIGWEDIVSALNDDCGTWAGLLFLSFIMASVLAILNAVTGVFCEKMTAAAQQDEKITLATDLRRIFFSQEDETGTEVLQVCTKCNSPPTQELHRHKRCEMCARRGTVASCKTPECNFHVCKEHFQVKHVSEAEFKEKADNGELEDFFKSIDVDKREATNFFKLLDINGDRKLTPKELVDGCLRLSGPAQALDVALLMRQQNIILQLVSGHLNKKGHSDILYEQLHPASPLSAHVSQLST